MLFKEQICTVEELETNCLTAGLHVSKSQFLCISYVQHILLDTTNAMPGLEILSVRETDLN